MPRRLLLLGLLALATPCGGGHVAVGEAIPAGAGAGAALSAAGGGLPPIRSVLDPHFHPERTFLFRGADAPVSVEQRFDRGPLQHGAACDGTGAAVWDAALVLCEFLALHPDLVRGKRVVELGSGTGVLGLVCARLGAERVILTDLPEQLPLLEDNVRRNALETRVAVRGCAWGSQPAVREVIAALGGPPDLVVASDVVYCAAADPLDPHQSPRAVFDALKATLKDLCPIGAQGLLSYKRRMNPEADAFVFESLAREFGVEQREVLFHVAGGAPLRGTYEILALTPLTPRGAGAGDVAGAGAGEGAGDGAGDRAGE
ncbi:putative methyltransferase-domain-containing protein, partial [Baffinella frigidus]